MGVFRHAILTRQAGGIDARMTSQYLLCSTVRGFRRGWWGMLIEETIGRIRRAHLSGGSDAVRRYAKTWSHEIVVNWRGRQLSGSSTSSSRAWRMQFHIYVNDLSNF
jgi:hypothetical protein